MNRGTRLVVSLGIAFIAYRICIEFMVFAGAIAIGLVAGGIAVALLPQRKDG